MLKTTSIVLLLLACFKHALFAQEAYPFPVAYLHLTIEQQDVKMAYMDVHPIKPNGKVVMLFHGKNFNGYYWKDVGQYLSGEGYRVIIPDQVGWGKSDKPNIHYSFHALALNNKALLDSLHIGSVIVVGHSTGGMLATRFTLMYPDFVERLVLENPVGLEDYRTFVPYISVEEEYATELAATYESYKKYMQSYFPVWKPEYEELVKQQAVALKDPDFKKVAWANALTYEMIYEQPVCYEFNDIKVKTLLIVGTADRTIVGKEKVPKELLLLHGQYQKLGKEVHSKIKSSSLVEIAGVGHIPHIQELERFERALDSFLSK